MTSLKAGIDTSNPEVTNISLLGFWLMVNDREYFIPFKDYPAFKNATIQQIHAVEQLAPDQFHWSDLDIDIDLRALQDPDAFPLVYKP